MMHGADSVSDGENRTRLKCLVQDSLNHIVNVYIDCRGGLIHNQDTRPGFFLEKKVVKS